MVDLELIRSLLTPAESKIVLLVLDGLGGLPTKPGGPTELEAAATPNLDRLASDGVVGLHEPVGPGITPGSGPGHIALFGYDPFRYKIGRGALTALGVGFDLQPGDLAARGNFCTLDATGDVTDRRAARISTERAAELCVELSKIGLPGAQVFVEPVSEHRFLLVLRGEGLSEAVTDTDPGTAGRAPLEARAEKPEAEPAADLVRQFVGEARDLLAGREPANMVLLRGFARRPNWPRFPEVFGLRAVAIAHYPMYRGVARLIGMDVVEVGAELDDLLSTTEKVWADYDFAFLHVKEPDKTGEDGDFKRKVEAIQAVDRVIPRLTAMEPDVVLVTGDHSTPATLRQHSWHPVPVLLWSKTCRPDDADRFGERWCRTGGLSLRPARELMPLALAHAGRLAKYGA